MRLKIICAVLAFGWASTFIWYHEADQRAARDRMISDLRWQAQLDAFSLHAQSINTLSDLVVKLAKQKSEE